MSGYYPDGCTQADLDYESDRLSNFRPDEEDGADDPKCGCNQSLVKIRKPIQREPEPELPDGELTW